MKIETKMPEKVILLHCHIFKNGGTTIDNVLRQNFGTKAIFQESPEEHHFLLSDTIIDIVKSTGPENIASISSHRMGLPPPSHPSITFIPLIMLRDPLDRLGSMYSFYKSQEANLSHECILAKRETLKSFAEILMSANLDSSFSNLQCQFFLGNYSPPRHPSGKNWPTIVNHLNAAPCVGLLEMFDESMVIWEDFLRQFIPTIDLSYVKKNVSANRSPDLEERLQLIHEQIGSALVSEFKRRNQYDYQLYNLARSNLQETINRHASFPERLANFRKKSLAADRAIHTNKQLLGTKKEIEKNNQNEGRTFVSRGEKQILINKFPKDTKITASGSIRIIGCGLFEPETGKQLSTVQQGQQVEVVVAVEVKEEILEPIVGITVVNANQDIVFAMNSLYSPGGLSSLLISKGDMAFSFLFIMPPLNSGSYTITPAFASGTQEEHTLLSTAKDAILFYIPKMIPQRMPGFLYINNCSLKSLSPP